MENEKERVSTIHLWFKTEDDKTGGMMLKITKDAIPLDVLQENIEEALKVLKESLAVEGYENRRFNFLFTDKNECPELDEFK